jgi:hypothetical protein
MLMNKENKNEQMAETDVKDVRKRIDFTFYSNLALVS